MGEENFHEEIKEEKVEKKEPKAETGSSRQEEVDVEDLVKQFVKLPAPEENSEELTVTAERFIKNFDTKGKDSLGNEFNSALTGTDHNFQLQTDKGLVQMSGWDLFNKVRTAAVKYKEKTGKLEGMKFIIKHIADGMKDRQAVKEKRVWDVEVTNMPE